MMLIKVNDIKPIALVTCVYQIVSKSAFYEVEYGVGGNLHIFSDQDCRGQTLLR